jgi:hypothetical protein
MFYFIIGIEIVYDQTSSDMVEGLADGNVRQNLANIDIKTGGWISSKEESRISSMDESKNSSIEVFKSSIEAKFKWWEGKSIANEKVGWFSGIGFSVLNR